MSHQRWSRGELRKGVRIAVYRYNICELKKNRCIKEEAVRKEKKTKIREPEDGER